MATKARLPSNCAKSAQGERIGPVEMSSIEQVTLIRQAFPSDCPTFYPRIVLA
jgi:hypothetical protein